MSFLSKGTSEVLVDINPTKDILSKAADVAEFAPLVIGLVGLIAGLDSMFFDRQIESGMLNLMKELKVSSPTLEEFVKLPDYWKFFLSAIPVSLSVGIGHIRERQTRRNFPVK